MEHSEKLETLINSAGNPDQIRETIERLERQHWVYFYKPSLCPAGMLVLGEDMVKLFSLAGSGPFDDVVFHVPFHQRRLVRIEGYNGGCIAPPDIAFAFKKCAKDKEDLSEYGLHIIDPMRTVEFETEPQLSEIKGRITTPEGWLK